MTKFSERLKQLRAAHGVSQQELADVLGVNKQTISGYERGVRRPAGEGAQELYEKLADFFNVDVSYLMGLTDFSIRLDDPCNSDSLPDKVAYKYSQLSTIGKEMIHNAIENEYDKQQIRLKNYKRVMSLDKITNLDDARAILGDLAAFGGYASDEQLLAMANAVLKTEKKKK